MYPRLQVSCCCCLVGFCSLLCSEVRVCGVVSPTGQRSRTRRPALLLVGVVGYFGCDYEGWCTRCSSDVRLPTLQWSRAMIQAWTLAGARSASAAGRPWRSCGLNPTTAARQSVSVWSLGSGLFPVCSLLPPFPRKGPVRDYTSGATRGWRGSGACLGL